MNILNKLIYSEVSETTALRNNKIIEKNDCNLNISY